MNLDFDLSATQLAILTLLRSEDIKGKKYTPIPGMTHLVKELFVIQKTDLGANLLSDLKFEPDNYGPFDETIFAALDGLKDAKYVNLNSSSTSYIKISLTEKGKELSDMFWNRLKDDIKSQFKYVKINYNHLSSEKLLERIYSAYPEMTVNSISKVAKKYRPKESVL
ncbi:MAG: hypothetical protein MIO93_01505 [ANME-2 cluster archaeon]|jgi:hypothetical protein|nr:hypothetical protein [ANME-2 cluster archaeon]